MNNLQRREDCGLLGLEKSNISVRVVGYTYYGHIHDRQPWSGCPGQP